MAVNGPQDRTQGSVEHAPWLGFEGAHLRPQRAHEGRGEVLADRVVSRPEGPLAFIDVVVLPSGVSVGRHTHGQDEELYVVVSGNGTATVDGDSRRVGPGDVVHNRAGGTHELHNDGAEDLRMVVVDIRTPLA